MVTVIGVRFKTAGKVYYFDPGSYDLNIGDNVIVETARGTEFGEVSMANTEVEDSEIVAPLKPIIRIATKQDIIKHEENEKKKARAMELCQEKIDNRGLEMKLIDVEYTFDNSKVIFYFTADGRVDFRELVKDLAGVSKMRIELRQIGVRDEAKMLGGVGSCGRGLCCATWLSDFEPVSIKMAKNQNLSLNPTKISGVCGRLMCCLKYENEIYQELRKGMPDVGEKIDTPEGFGKVIESDVLQGKVKVRLFTDEMDDNGTYKLGTDIFTFKKAEITRQDKKEKKEKPAKHQQPQQQEPKAAEPARKGRSRSRGRRRKDRGGKKDHAAQS